MTRSPDRPTSDERTGPRPRLVMTRSPRHAEAVVVVLHGGGGPGIEPVTRTQPSVLRMIPVARRIARAGHGKLAVIRLINAVKGFGGGDPLVNVHWALDEAESRLGPGKPIALVGHSLGGFVALTAASDPRVRAVVALAPWLSGREPTHQLADTPTLIVHGTDDRVTDPQKSATFARKATAAGYPVGFVEVSGGEHTMLRRLSTFDGLASAFVSRALLTESSRWGERAALLDRAMAGEHVVV